VVSDTFTSFKKHNVPDSLRLKLYIDLIESLYSLDWDTDDECVGQDPVFDDALEIVRRRWYKRHRYDYNEWYGDNE